MCSLHSLAEYDVFRAGLFSVAGHSHLRGQQCTGFQAAAVVGDTVGDPFKDTASVAMNPVVKFTALFGLLHGYAHGLELPESAAPAAYAMGFLAATASLHLGGIAMGAATRERYAMLSRLLGGAIAISGAYLLASS